MSIKPVMYSNTGCDVWYGKSRVVCEADTEAMATFIAAALNEKSKTPPVKK